MEGDSITFDAANPTTGWHGIRFLTAQNSSHLSYCIIQHGRATGTGSCDPNTWGGGILCDGSNPVITHCAIRNYWAQYFDGGITIIKSSNPVLRYCTIANNESNLDECGVGILYDSNPILMDCDVLNNSAWLGAGIVIWNAHASDVSSGIYFAQLQIHHKVKCIKMVLLK